MNNFDKLKDALENVNIFVEQYDHQLNGYKISFDGDEDQFKNALELMMLTESYRKQDESWFPGDPGEVGEQSYFIENDDIQFCISFNEMLLSDII